MKVVHSPSPSANPKKREKINLFENDDPEEVLVDPKDATLEHAEKLRQRYKLNYCRKAVGGRKKA